MKTSLQILLLVIFFISCSKDKPIVQYKLTTEIIPTEGGTVSPSSGTFDVGTEVMLTATPSSEYIFKEWTGGMIGTTNPMKIIMSSDKNLSVVFEKRKYPLSIIIEGEGTVTEEIISTEKSTDYPSGTNVRLTGVPKSGWEFVSWNGDFVGTDNPIEIIVNTSKTITVEFKKIYKNYLKTSYELSNYDSWFSSDDLYYNGVKYLNFNPLVDQQHCQLDIDGDGDEDIFYYDSYSLEAPTPNPPPSVFINNGAILEKVEWIGPSLINPHGSKLLVGDFNNDSLPDIFTCVGFDVPDGIDGSNQVSHLLFNSPNGFNRVTEFVAQLGYHHTGCSGDIDNDGDLDIIMINFAYWSNGVTSKVLWNDSKGNFTYGTIGFSEIAPIDHSELYDVNNDGFLDLVIDYIEVLPDSKRIPHMIIMWGNGKDFTLGNSTTFLLDGNLYLMDIDFTDVDSDGISEIIISGTDLIDVIPNNDWNQIKYFINLYKSDDNGLTYTDKTNLYFDDIYFPRFGHLSVKDLDKNGKMDIFTSDKKTNTKWEWNGSKFVRVY